MANLMHSFNTGVSGLRSAQASLTTSSHNLANAQTKGYSRQQVINSDAFYVTTTGQYDNMMQTGKGTVIQKTRQIRNEFLDIQYRSQIGREGFYEANQKAAMEIEDMIGELYGEQFQTGITELKQALESLATQPDNVVYKDQVVSLASQFTERASLLQNELSTYQVSLNTEIKEQVDQINDITARIKELNKKIRKYEANGDPANDYRDERNLLLDDLSKIIDIDINEERDGTISIYTQGAFLVDAVQRYELSVAPVSDTSQLLKPVWSATGGNFFLKTDITYDSTKKTDIGSLRGLMIARGDHLATYDDMPIRPDRSDYDDENSYKAALKTFEDEELEPYNKNFDPSIVMTVQAQVDTLVHEIVTMVNDALCPNKEVTFGDINIKVLDADNALRGDDRDYTMGTELFSRRSTERYTTVNVRLSDDSNELTEVKLYNEEGRKYIIDDTNNTIKYVYDYNTGKYYDDKGKEVSEDIVKAAGYDIKNDTPLTATLYTTSQLVMNPEILRDASKIPTLHYDDADGQKKSYAFEELLSIAQSFDKDFGTTDPNTMTKYNVNNFYSAIVNDLATVGNVWNGIVENQQSTVYTLYNEREDVMGVSNDEELSDLIKFQRCYDASSRYITTVSEMLEYLIERLGS